MNECEFGPGDVILLKSDTARLIFGMSSGEDRIVVVVSVVEPHPSGHAVVRTLISGRTVNVWGDDGIIVWRDEW